MASLHAGMLEEAARRNGHAAPAPVTEDPLAPSRGVVVGLVIGAVIWMLVVALGVALVTVAVAT